MKIEKLIPLLTVIGFILTVVGTIDTAWQIFHRNTVWIFLICAGVALLIWIVQWLIRLTSKILKTDNQDWKIVEGVLYIGEEPNVAFRIDTIQIILNAMESRLGDSERFKTLSSEVGFEVGYKFFEDLLITNRKRFIKPGRRISEKLDLWSEYDSATGLGVFEDAVVYQSKKGNRAQVGGQVVVKNSFLIHGRTAEKPYCGFMEGYIRGIIEKILESEKLSPANGSSYVEEKECGCMTGKNECHFEVEVLAQPSQFLQRQIRY